MTLNYHEKCFVPLGGFKLTYATYHVIEGLQICTEVHKPHRNYKLESNTMTLMIKHTNDVEIKQALSSHSLSITQIIFSNKKHTHE